MATRDHNPADAHGHARLAAAVRVVSGMTLLSRFGGLLRDVLVLRLFGATALGSAFAAGFAIPNLFRRLFGEGALSAAFIPEYTRLVKDDPAQADRLASLTVAALLAVTTALTVLIELGLLAALVLLPHDPQRADSLVLIMVMLPFMPLICAAAILGGILQVHGRFGPAASGPLLLNGFIIVVAGFHFIAGRPGDMAAAVWIGIATVLSGLTQCLWFNRLLRGHVRWTRAFAAASEPARRMVRKFVPVLIGLGTLQINTFLDMLIAMWPAWVGPTVLGRSYPLDLGSNAILTAAQRPYQFPLGVFGIAVATAIFPLLSRHAADPGAFTSTLRRGVRLSFFIGLPATIGLVLVSRDLIAAFFSGSGLNAFSSDDVDRATLALRMFALGIWAYSINHVLTRAFYATGDTRTPMVVSIAMVGLNLAMNLVLIWRFREAGLALATSISAVVQCVVLSVVLRRKGLAAVDRATLAGWARVAVAAALMGGLVVVAMLMPTPGGWSGSALRLLIGTAVGGLGFLACARLLRCPELRWLLERPPRDATPASVDT